MGYYLFYYENMNIGGCQLLILNYARELLSRGNKVSVICEYAEEMVIKDYPDIEITQLGSDIWFSDKAIKNLLKKYQNAYITTFLWDDYSRVFSLKQINQKLLLYAVHRDAVRNIAYSRMGILRIIRKFFLTPTIKNMVKNNVLAIMDEQTRNCSERYFGFSFSKARVIHIPVNSIDIGKKEYKDCISSKNILAIARAEFPFKGYLLGLIDALKNDLIPSDYTLTIVTYGKDRIQLVKAIDNLENSKRRRVSLLGETPYSDLGLFINCILSM